MNIHNFWQNFLKILNLFFHVVAFVAPHRVVAVDTSSVPPRTSFPRLPGPPRQTSEQVYWFAPICKFYLHRNATPHRFGWPAPRRSLARSCTCVDRWQAQHFYHELTSGRHVRAYKQAGYNLYIIEEHGPITLKKKRLITQLRPINMPFFNERHMPCLYIPE